MYFTCGGSESVETALKLARQYQVEIGQTRRYQVLSRTQSYHGSTLGALSVSGNKRRREIYLPMVREFAHVGIPYCYRCNYDCTDGCRNCGLEYAAELERAIESANGEAAAFIFEPVSGATLGAVVPPPGYLQKVAEVCRRHGVLLIADEVMTGMGRTGRNFAIEHWDIAPDILIAAKGLSSGYAPLGAVIATKKVVDGIASGSFLHGFTYNAHPVSLAAGRAVLHRLQQQKLVHAADSGRERQHRRQVGAFALDPARPENGRRSPRHRVAARRGVCGRQANQEALRSGIELRRTRNRAALKRGLLVYPIQGCVDGTSGDHLLIAPPASHHRRANRLGGRATERFHRRSSTRPK